MSEYTFNFSDKILQFVFNVVVVLNINMWHCVKHIQSLQNNMYKVNRSDANNSGMEYD